MGDNAQIELKKDSKLSYGKHNEIIFESKNENLIINPKGHELKIYEIVISQRKN